MSKTLFFLLGLFLGIGIFAIYHETEIGKLKDNHIENLSDIKRIKPTERELILDSLRIEYEINNLTKQLSNDKSSLTNSDNF